MSDLTLEQLQATEAYKSAPPENQAMAESRVTQRAWTETKKTTDYIAGGEEKRQEVVQAFDQKFPMGAATHLEEDNQYNSFLENMGAQVSQGAGNTWDAMRSFDDVLTGVPGDDLAMRISRSMAKAAKEYTPEALKEVNAHMLKETKRWEAAESFTDKFAAVGQTLLATGKEVVNNPEGVAYLAAQSAANMLPSLVGGVAGAAVAGPVGAAVGTFQGSFAVETGSYLREIVGDAIQEKGLQPTEANIQQLLDNPSFVRDAIKRSLLKGAGTAGTDTLLAVVGGSIGTKAARTAERNAVRTALRAAGRVGTEVVSEPISEAVGELAAEGEVDMGKLMGETLGGIGSNVAMASAHKAMFGAKETVKAVPKAPKVAGSLLSKLARKKSPEEVEAIRQAKAPTAHDYVTKVDAAVASGETVDGKVDPLMSADVAKQQNLKKDADPITKVKNLDHVQQLSTNLVDKRAALIEKVKAFPVKADRTKEENTQREGLLGEAKALDKTIATLEPILKSMQVQGTDQQAALREAHKALRSDDTEAVRQSILSIFGSRRGAAMASSKAVADILTNPKIDDSVKSQVKAIQTYQAAEKELTEVQAEGKDLKTVHSNIVEGNSQFKGTKTYLQGVSTAVQAGNAKMAQEQLAGLKKFATMHSEKAATFQKAFDEVQVGTMSEESIAAIEDYSQKRNYREGKSYSIHSGSGNLVATMQKEAATLTEATALAETMIAAIPTKQPAAQAGVTTESGTTEVEDKGTEAAAEVPVASTESSVRPVVTPAAAKVEPTQTQTPTKVTKKGPTTTQSLQSMGFPAQTIGIIDKETTAEIAIYGDDAMDKGLMAATLQDLEEKYAVAPEEELVKNPNFHANRINAVKYILNTLHGRKLPLSTSYTPITRAEAKKTVTPLLLEMGFNTEVIGTLSSEVAKEIATYGDDVMDRSLMAASLQELEEEYAAAPEEDLLKDPYSYANKLNAVKHILNTLHGRKFPLSVPYIPVTTQPKETTNETTDASKGQGRADETITPEITEGPEDGPDTGTETGQESTHEVPTPELATDGSQAEEVHASPVATELTTPDELDPTNSIKNTFEIDPRAKGILHTTQDAMEDFTPAALKSAFNENNPLDEKAEVAIGAIAQFNGKFQDHFDKVFAVMGVGSKKLYDSKGIRRLFANLPNKLFPDGIETKQKAKFAGEIIQQLYNQNLQATPANILILTNAVTQDQLQAVPVAAIANALNTKVGGTKNIDFRFTDPIQFLLDSETGVLPANVINALAAASYKWIAARSSESLFNLDKDIIALMGLEDDHPINSTAHKLLDHIGIVDTMLQESLGEEVYQLLGIKETEVSDHDATDKLKISLGLQAIATMQSMDYIKQTDVLRGAKPGEEATATTGFEGLVNMQKDEDQDKYKGIEATFLMQYLEERGPEDRKDYSSYEGTGFMTFYKVKDGKDGKIDSDINEAYVAPFKGSKHAWDRIFKGENDKATYSFEPKKEKKGPAKLKGTNFTASQEQTDNLNRHENRPYKISARNLSMYMLLPEKLRLQMQGWKDPKTVHISERDSVEGTNLGITRTNDAITDFLEDALQHGGYETEFYIPEEFWRQGRMGQIGAINPQGDKTHRFLFNMSAWEVDLDLKDADMRRQFMEAVALGLDIEVSKEGGLDQAITKTDDLLNTPIMQEAIAAIQYIFEEQGSMDTLNMEYLQGSKEFYTPAMTSISDAVMKVGTGMHGMKALVEYAQYLTAVNEGATTFKTDLITEIDGVSNGPTIARIQLILDSADGGRFLAALQNAGVAFSEEQPGLAEHLARSLSHDAYMSTGFAWNEALVEIEKDMKDKVAESSVKKKAWLQGNLDRSRAMGDFFGRFTDAETGAVNKLVRNLSKDPTMRTVYGMGPKALLRELQVTFNSKFAEKLEKIVATGDVQAFHDFARIIHTITGRQVFTKESMVNYKLNSEHILTTELTDADQKAIGTNLTFYHGMALKKAIGTVFGDMQKAFKPLNTGVGISAVGYNAVRKLKIQHAQSVATKENRKVTVGEFQKIDADLVDMFPNIVTASGSKIPLAKMSKAKQYSDKATGLINQEVNQTYKEDSKIAGKKAAAPKKMGVDGPGVAPTILSIHNLDSMVANGLMAIYDMLNNHDGFTGAVGTAKKMAVSANDIFYETMAKFDLGASMHQSVIDTQAAFEEQVKSLHEIGLTKAQVDEAMAQEFIAQGVRVFAEPGMEEMTKMSASSYPTYIKLTMAEMKRVADETSANKAKFLAAVVKMEQYSYPGGEYHTGNKPQTTLEHSGLTYDLRSITSDTEAKLNKSMAATKEVARQIADVEVRGSSQNMAENVLDPKDYAMAQEVNNMNLTDVYDQIKDDSNISDSVEHASYLRGVLESIVQNVMNPVSLHLKEDPTSEAEGAFVHLGSSKDKIFISSQNQIIGPVSGALNQGIRMSTGEVYTHEMLHHVLHTAMNINNGLRQKVEHLHKMAKQHLGVDGYKVFLNDPTMDVTDPANKFEVAAAKERYNYIFGLTKGIKTTTTNTATGIETTHERSNQMDEFIVLGLTNENFMKALAGIELKGSAYNRGVWTGFWAKSIQGMLATILEAAYGIIYNGFISRTATGTMAVELNTLAKLLANKQSQRKSALFETMRKAGMLTSKVSVYSNAFIKKAAGSAPVAKTILELKRQTKLVAASDTAYGQFLRDRVYAYDRLNYGFMKSTITEMRGRTERMAWLHKLLSRRQIFLDQAKEAETETTITTCKRIFKKPLDKAQKTALTKVVLKTDMSVLLRSLGMNRLRAILGSEKTLDADIARINKELTGHAKLAPYAAYYRKASDALGHYMIHSRQRSGENVMLNARLIAMLSGTEEAGSLMLNQVEGAEALIDQLASLYAIKYASGMHKKIILQLMTEDPEGVNGTMSLHEILKEKALENSFNGNKAKFTKGYTKQILNPRISFLYGTLDDEAEMAAKGYTRQAKAVERDGDDPTNSTPFYIYTGRTGRSNDLSPGAFSFTGNKAKGTNSEKIAAQMDETTTVGKINNAEIIRKKKEISKQMMDPGFIPALENGNFMVAKVNDLGNITGYRYTMAENTKDDFLEQVTEFDKILGSMAGQLVDKARSPIVNEELVKGLHAVYIEGYDKNPGGFVEIGPGSNDPRLREIYYMMPPKAKKVMRDTFGMDRLFMPKDMVDIAFGYRQYGIMQEFTKDPKDRAMIGKMIVGMATAIFGDTAAQKMSTVEHVAIELTKLAKSNIIVRSLHVTLGNFGSNLVYLKSRGVPLSKIVKLSYEAWSWGNKYQEDKSSLDQAVLSKAMAKKEGKSTTKLDIDIVRLKDAIARNPTTISIESGLMPSLVDDVETVTGGENFPSPFEKKMTELGDSLPSLVQTVGKNVLLTQDSKMFKVLNNAVKMTDFVGRHVLYNHYIQEGMDHDKAIASVEDAFINFAVPTHKMVQYGNDIGLLWFTKYATRILKVVKDSVVDKPFDVFMAYIFSVHTGMDNIINSVPTGIDGILDNMGDPFTNTITSLDEPIFFNAAEELLKR